MTKNIDGETIVHWLRKVTPADRIEEIACGAGVAATDEWSRDTRAITCSRCKKAAATAASRERSLR